MERRALKIKQTAQMKALKSCLLVTIPKLRKCRKSSLMKNSNQFTFSKKYKRMLYKNIATKRIIWVRFNISLQGQVPAAS